VEVEWGPLLVYIDTLATESESTAPLPPMPSLDSEDTAPPRRLGLVSRVTARPRPQATSAAAPRTPTATLSLRPTVPKALGRPHAPSVQPQRTEEEEVPWWMRDAMALVDDATAVAPSLPPPHEVETVTAAAPSTPLKRSWSALNESDHTHLHTGHHEEMEEVQPPPSKMPRRLDDLVSVPPPAADRLSARSAVKPYQPPTKKSGGLTQLHPALPPLSTATTTMPSSIGGSLSRAHVECAAACAPSQCRCSPRSR